MAAGSKLWRGSIVKDYIGNTCMAGGGWDVSSKAPYPQVPPALKVIIRKKPEIWWGFIPTVLGNCCESNSRWKGWVGLIAYLGVKVPDRDEPLSLFVNYILRSKTDFIVHQVPGFCKFHSTCNLDDTTPVSFQPKPGFNSNYRNQSLVSCNHVSKYHVCS